PASRMRILTIRELFEAERTDSLELAAPARMQEWPSSVPLAQSRLMPPAAGIARLGEKLLGSNAGGRAQIIERALLNLGGNVRDLANARRSLLMTVVSPSTDIE